MHARIRRKERQAGFTLLEILVVVAILGLLIGLVAPAALRQLGGAQVSVAKQSIQRLGGVLDLYRLDMGSYPTTEQGPPLDPWNHPYLYRNPSMRPGRDYDLCSRGPNAQGGEAVTAEGMICN